MIATDTDDYKAAARELKDWLLEHANTRISDAAMLESDTICVCAECDAKKFLAAALLLDDLMAGLILVKPHPRTQAEIVQWSDPVTSPPLPGSSVLMIVEGLPEVVLGWFMWSAAVGGRFRGDSQPLENRRVLFWAPVPTGPDSSEKGVPA